MERGFVLLDREARFNGVHITELRGPLTAELLRPALAWARCRYPLLGCRLDDAPLRFVPCTGELPLRVASGEGALAALVEAELNHPFPDAGGALARFALVHEPGADRAALVFSHHHVISDALSGVALARELLTAAAALDAGRPLPTPTPLPLRPPLGDLLAADARGLRRLPAMNRFLLRHLHTRLVVRPRRLEEAPPDPAPRRNRWQHYRLERSDTARLVARAGAEATSVHGALCAALLLATASEAGLEVDTPLGCFTAVNLRPRLAVEVGEEMGLYVSQVGTTHRLRAGGPFWDLARDVKRELVRVLASGEQLITLPLMGLLIPSAWPGSGGAGPRYARRMASLSFAAVGVTNIGRLPLRGRIGRFTIDDHHIAPGLSVVGRVTAATSTFDDRLTVNLIHVEPLVPPARAAAIGRGMIDRLLMATR